MQPNFTTNRLIGVVLSAALGTWPGKRLLGSEFTNRLGWHGHLSVSIGRPRPFTALALVAAAQPQPFPPILFPKDHAGSQRFSSIGSINNGSGARLELFGILGRTIDDTPLSVNIR